MSDLCVISIGLIQQPVSGLVSVVNYSQPYEEILRMGNTFLIKKNGKYGAANYNGNVIIDPVYDKLEFGYSEIIAEKNGKKVTFDKYGKLITDFH